MTRVDRTDCYIRHIANAVPPRSMDQAETIRQLSERSPSSAVTAVLRRVFKSTGIKKRHLAALELQEGREPADQLYPPYELCPNGPTTAQRLDVFDALAEPLMNDLLSDIPETTWPQIRRLVTVNCTSAASPGLERLVFKNRPISRRVDRYHLGFMGCSAGLAGLRLINETNRQADSLLVALELSSLHVQYTDKMDRIVANALFADGASAVVVSPQREALDAICLGKLDTPRVCRVRDCQCFTLDAHADQMVWGVGNHGFALHLAIELPDTLAANISGAAAEFLGDNGLTLSDVPHWAIHPGGPKIVESVCEALKLPDRSAAAAHEVLSEYGNMSSSTIFFIIRRIIESGATGLLAAVAFGPGLTIELALLEIEEN